MLRKIVVLFLLASQQSFAGNIGVVLAGQKSNFWKAIRDGIEKGKQDLNIKDEFIYRSTIDDDLKSRDYQLNMISDFKKFSVKGLIIAPNYFKAQKEKIDFNVPLVVIDRDTNQIKYDAAVMTDNYNAGKTAASFLKNIKSNKTVGVFRLQKNVTSTTQREEGFISEAKRLGFEIVFDEYVGPVPNEAIIKMKEVFSKMTKVPNVIFTSNEPITYSGILFLRESKISNVKIIGFDFRNEFISALLDKTLLGLVVQDANEMGRKSVEILYQLLQKKNSKGTFYIEPILVTDQNLKTDYIQRKLSQYDVRNP